MRESNRDEMVRVEPVLGVVCPDCGARIGKPCVAVVPLCGVGTVGMPIEGHHALRVAAAREAGVS